MLSPYVIDILNTHSPIADTQTIGTESANVLLRVRMKWEGSESGF